MRDSLINYLHGQKILILGFGREGRSTFSFIRKLLPGYPLAIADRDDDIPQIAAALFETNNVIFFTGERYLEKIASYSLVFKSPGIGLKDTGMLSDSVALTSQTDLFLRCFAPQTIGITGSKGKSTTAALIYHILKQHTPDTLLVGNIGIPPLDLFDKVASDSLVVFEMSSHQLQYVNNSPHIAVLLNLFEEHLDYYRSFEEYCLAKWNIAAYQSKGDYFLYDAGNVNIMAGLEHFIPGGNMVPFNAVHSVSPGAFNLDDKVVCIHNDGTSYRYDFRDRTNLPGGHNLRNIMAAVLVAGIVGVPPEITGPAVRTFEGLPHRLEFVGNFCGVDFYDDAIATIPEAVMEALMTLKRVDILILGGMDRGVDYSALVRMLARRTVPYLVFTGAAGKRMYYLMKTLFPLAVSGSKCFVVDDFAEVKDILRDICKKGMTCLLSPAAPSYDCFPGFHEKGNLFRSWLQSL